MKIIISIIVLVAGANAFASGDSGKQKSPGVYSHEVELPNPEGDVVGVLSGQDIIDSQELRTSKYEDIGSSEIGSFIYNSLDKLNKEDNLVLYEVMGFREQDMVIVRHDKKYSEINIDNVVQPLGCGKSGLCVGEQRININLENVLVTIKGIMGQGTKYFLKVEEGEYKGRYGGNWSVDDFAVMKGSHDGFRVGDIVLNMEMDYVRVKLVAIHDTDKFVIKYLEGEFEGKREANWQTDSFFSLPSE